MSKSEIIGKIDSVFPFLREKYNVEKIGIFGSFVRGEETENSDIDILVKFKLPIGFFAFMRLENYLSGILNKKVDLVSEKALKLSIKEDVLKEVAYV